MLRIILCIFLLLQLCACTQPIGNTVDNKVFKSQFAFYNLETNYENAVRDAKNLSKDYLRDDLLIIDKEPYDRRLVVKNIGNHNMVLVATFLKEDYMPYWMNRDLFRLDFDSFVTIPGEWVDKDQDFTRLNDRELRERIIRKMGMHYLSENTYFVVFYADLNALIRPAFNPDIKTPMSLLDYADNTPHEFKNWLNKKIHNAYENEPHYPFTRLGYTYDWGSINPRADGLSEFVVPKGTLVKVKSILTYQDFIKYYVRLPSYKNKNTKNL